MDDDIFHPEKIETTIVYFSNDTNNETTLVNGNKAGSSIVSEFNWIGNPTTIPLFQKKTYSSPSVSFQEDYIDLE
ncbi:hypothetical protein BLD50_03155 [Bacillus cereus]|nr:hypothetical protein BLD50_03155 [Bacillus cereus]